MANFSDYLKEMDKDVHERIENLFKTSKEDLINHMNGLRDNLNLRIEELKCMKYLISDYDYLYIMVKLKVSREHITDAIDLLNGWNPEDEENIPADMIFEGEPDDKD